MATVRDKLWLFGVRAHQDDVLIGRTEGVHKRSRSRITPAEAALMLDIPNVMMINCQGEPVPFSGDAYGYAESFIKMKNVLWSCTGSGGFRIGNEEQFICKLAEEYPNIRGAFCDDFLREENKLLTHEERTAKQLKTLTEIRSSIDKACRPMEVHAVYYTYESDTVDPKVLDMIDVLSFWTWKSKGLDNLEERFERFENQCPTKRKMLGIYMYDFPEKMPITLERMEHQCEYALKLLKEKRIEGIIIEANSVMGIGLESEIWLRDWIKKNKYTEIPD